MKLAEALALRADLNKRIAELSTRMVSSAMVQEGMEPAENANQLLVQSEVLALELQKLISDINTTNLAIKLPSGKSLTEAISERDMLKTRIAIHRRLAEAGLPRQNVQTRSEVRFVSQVNVTELRQKADHLAREHRELDVQIQSANWSTDLIES